MDEFNKILESRKFDLIKSLRLTLALCLTSRQKNYIFQQIKEYNQKNHTRFLASSFNFKRNERLSDDFREEDTWNLVVDSIKEDYFTHEEIILLIREENRCEENLGNEAA